MSKLSSSERNSLPSSDFVGPDRSFPVPDISHARAALSMAHNASDPAAIRAKVHKRFPQIGGGDPQKEALHRAIKGN